MMLREIKTLHDILLAYHNNYKLMNKAGKYFRIIGICTDTAKDSPVYCVRVTFNNKTFVYSLDDAIDKLKIVLPINKEHKMEGYIERMIQEHKELVVHIDKLHSWVYGGAHEKVDAAEFANEAIQLRAMKVYEEALRARLYNAGVNFVDGEYLVSIDHIENETKDTSDND